MRASTGDRSTGQDEGEGGDGDVRLLVVDDDEDLLATLASALRASGYVVHTATTGNGALDLVREEGICVDVLVADLVLPDVFGSQVALDHSFQCPDAKVVYMSGRVPPDTILEASATTSDVRFLNKPFRPSELIEVIEETLAPS